MGKRKKMYAIISPYLIIQSLPGAPTLLLFSFRFSATNAFVLGRTKKKFHRMVCFPLSHAGTLALLRQIDLRLHERSWDLRWHGSWYYCTKGKVYYLARRKRLAQSERARHRTYSITAAAEEKGFIPCREEGGSRECVKRASISCCNRALFCRVKMASFRLEQRGKNGGF